jgi:hypothetical protein
VGNLNGVECVEKCEIKCWADAIRAGGACQVKIATAVRMCSDSLVRLLAGRRGGSLA